MQLWTSLCISSSQFENDEHTMYNSSRRLFVRRLGFLHCVAMWMAYRCSVAGQSLAEFVIHPSILGSGGGWRRDGTDDHVANIDSTGRRRGTEGDVRVKFGISHAKWYYGANMPPKSAPDLLTALHESRSVNYGAICTYCREVVVRSRWRRSRV